MVPLFRKSHSQRTVRNDEAKLAGIRDGASHYAKILSVFYDNLDTWDPNDPRVIIKINISNVFKILFVVPLR